MAIVIRIYSYDYSDSYKNSNNNEGKDHASNNNFPELLAIFFTSLEIVSDCKNAEKANKNQKSATNQRHRNILSGLSSKNKPIHKIKKKCYASNS